MEVPPDSASTLRQKKAALLEVIELQRKLIESHDADAAAVVAVEGAGADDDRELEWHTEQAKRLDKFKAALNAARLQPDEFLLLVPLEWAVSGSGTSSGKRARDLVPYLLRINARSQLTFVPQPLKGSDGAGGSSPSPFGDGSAGSSTDDVLAGAARARVYFMDMLRHVRLAPDESATISRTNASASLLGSSLPTSVCEVVLEWRSRQPPLCCLTPEGPELVEVLGSHLRRYNSSRVTQVAGLKKIHALKCTTFSPSNPLHAQLLKRLWS